jgi:hypothetical protein
LASDRDGVTTKKFRSGSFAKQASSSPGPNPTIANYNASFVKNYYSMSSLVRFENKKYVLLNDQTPQPTTKLALLLGGHRIRFRNKIPGFESRQSLRFRFR